MKSFLTVFPALASLAMAQTIGPSELKSISMPKVIVSGEPFNITTNYTNVMWEPFVYRVDIGEVHADKWDDLLTRGQYIADLLRPVEGAHNERKFGVFHDEVTFWGSSDYPTRARAAISGTTVLPPGDSRPILEMWEAQYTFGDAVSTETVKFEKIYKYT